MRRLDPGEWCAVSLVGAALAMDVVLIRKGHKPISEVVRANPHSRRLVRALSAHLCDQVPGDLLTLAGARLAKRAVDAVATPS
jgi:hypothetical protein